jgi:hypothetical protein
VRFDSNESFGNSNFLDQGRRTCWINFETVSIDTGGIDSRILDMATILIDLTGVAFEIRSIQYRKPLVVMSYRVS